MIRKPPAGRYAFLPLHMAPESSVDMEVMKGFGGRPVKILNLPNPAYQDYTIRAQVSAFDTKQ
mgnify:CR=1 FL=1